MFLGVDATSSFVCIPCWRGVSTSRLHARARIIGQECVTFCANALSQKKKKKNTHFPIVMLYAFLPRLARVMWPHNGATKPRRLLQFDDGVLERVITLVINATPTASVPTIKVVSSVITRVLARFVRHFTNSVRCAVTRCLRVAPHLGFLARVRPVPVRCPG